MHVQQTWSQYFAGTWSCTYIYFCSIQLQLAPLVFNSQCVCCLAISHEQGTVLTILAAGEWKPGGVIIGLGIPGGGCPIINLRGVCFGPSGTCCRASSVPVSSFSKSSSFIALTGWGFFIKRLGGTRPRHGTTCTIESSCKDNKR